MKLNIDPRALQCALAVPADVADKHLKLASHSALKVILFIMKNGTDVAADEICKALAINETDLNEALIYWREAGLLVNAEGSAEADNAKVKANAKPAVSVRTERATRSQIARRADESKEIRLVLQQAEVKFRRPLKETEKGALVYILDNLGMAAPVVLMLIEHAVAENRTSASFLESTAVDWINRNVDSVALAEKEMQRSDERRGCWAIIRRALSITEARRASAKEAEASVRWIVEWGFNEAMIRLAYDQCVDNTGKVSVPYIDKVLKNWHAAGITTPAAVKDAEKKPAGSGNGNAPSFDLSLF